MRHNLSEMPVRRFARCRTAVTRSPTWISPPSRTRRQCPPSRPSAWAMPAPATRDPETRTPDAPDATSTGEYQGQARVSGAAAGQEKSSQCDAPTLSTRLECSEMQWSDVINDPSLPDLPYEIELRWTGTNPDESCLEPPWDSTGQAGVPAGVHAHRWRDRDRMLVRSSCGGKSRRCGRDFRCRRWPGGRQSSRGANVPESTSCSRLLPLSRRLAASSPTPRSHEPRRTPVGRAYEPGRALTRLKVRSWRHVARSATGDA